MIKHLFLIFFATASWSCKDSTLFKKMDKGTGINFENTIENTDEMNIFNYRNFYNGAGVAIGDINNDGLSDIYFVKNQGPNTLYLNKGNWKFEDISKSAKVSGTHAFSTGAVMADVNGDGLLDIYVCNSGELKSDDRANELFINNGDLTFTEKAAEYGLNDKGYSTHAAFFDYDIDGDLDMFLLQNSSYPVNKLGFKNIRNERDTLAGQKLFRNDDNKFIDISAEAGIYGSLIGFGLGITIGDLNNDQFPDIYISNDFYERDYLYLNQKNGTFKEDLTKQMGHISMSSMGADVADINNDDHLDIFSTDMLPWDDYRLKTTMLYEDINLYNLKLESDFYHQYSRNMLQLNNGNGSFSEIGALAGVHATDWSWGALIFDMDTDGQKDLFVANGIYKNVTDQDFVVFLNDENTLSPYANGQKKFSYKDFMEKMESTPIPNYAFKNNGGLKFKNEAMKWGLDDPSFSSGAAYGDLDNDGDLDLITNNTNQAAGIYRNNSVEKNKTNYLKVNLIGSTKNTKGIGARVKLYANGTMQVLEQMPNRGFESSVDYIMNFGLGSSTKVDSLVVFWPNNTKEKILTPKVNTKYDLFQKNGKNNPREAEHIYQDFDITEGSGLNFTHEENYFIDYDRDGLLKQMYSREGPGLAVGDVDGNGTDDVFIGAGTKLSSGLFMQDNTGRFTKKALPALQIADVVDAAFFDADNDKDLDLMLITGGNDDMPDDQNTRDILLINDGKGNFTEGNFPKIAHSGAAVAAFDKDKDGDLDLIVAGRLKPMQYGMEPKHQLYLNEGKGQYKLVDNIWPSIGMITDMEVGDIDNDQTPEIIVSQDWGTIAVINIQTFQINEIANTKGWWNSLKIHDIDLDGDNDLVVGNAGENNRFMVGSKTPSKLIIKDIDNNLRIDHIYDCFSEDGKAYPMVLKTDLQKQIPAIKKRYIYFKDFGKKTSKEIFGEALQGAKVLEVNESRSGVLINDKGTFTFVPLPVEAQFTPIFGINFFDYNGDKLPDLLLTGNYFDTQTELARYDANYGQVFTNRGKGSFTFVPNKKTGLSIKGAVRNALPISINQQKNTFILAKNSEKVQLIKL